MKIAFDSQIFALQQHGGISRHFCGLAAHLAAIEGIQVRIFAPFHWNAHLDALPKGLVSGVRVPRIPRTERAFRQGGSWLARTAIARYAPQIVHETYYSASPTAPKRARAVVTVYDMIHERFPSLFPDHDPTSERKRIATQRADHVICISQSTRKDVLELFELSEDKVSVVHLGFDRLTPETSESGQNRPYLLYVGYRSGYKNFESFVRAYAGSPRLRNSVDIVCFGGGAFSPRERALFSDLRIAEDRLRRLEGSDRRLASLYRGAAALVYPSLSEGFGLPPLEAMSLGCPVICSRTGSIPEVVGDAGEYFDPADQESTRSSIERVLGSTERRSELIARGRSRCKLFSWERCARETLDVYRKVTA